MDDYCYAKTATSAKREHERQSLTEKKTKTADECACLWRWEEPIPRCMSLEVGGAYSKVHVFGGGRKPEYPEGTHAVTGRTCKLHTERSRAQTSSS
ncbi:uncharacterized protein LOC133632438 isoform X3 [Entelurus aequoreus]|uniref:uncharacterized protein LOC133632438 isoform X3 n=1 Tax=Entelurus aequoreus TaxID=161455 RepID=UPI002B1D5558|nr:uncharacterized protein LOC133632438 isoform X3 [Entelurus aequoreus]